MRSLLLLALVLSTPVLASDLQGHRTVTERALQALGWEREAIQDVVHCNVAVDFGKLPPIPLAMAAAAMPGPAREVDRVRALAMTAPFSPDATRGFHFNSLYTFDDIALRWQALEAWAEERAALGEDPHALLGLVAHAVQDFYEHANWMLIIGVFAPSYLDPQDFPLWEDLADEASAWSRSHPDFPREAVLNRMRASNAFMSPREEEGGLQTGRGGSPKPFTGDPWLHRHHFGSEREVVEALAVKAVTRWAERIADAPGNRAPLRDTLGP